jgi:hypothetical protein
VSTGRPRRASSTSPSDLASVWPERASPAERAYLGVVAPVAPRTADDLTSAVRGVWRYGLTGTGLAAGRASAGQDPTAEQLAAARTAAGEVLAALGLVGQPGTGAGT